MPSPSSKELQQAQLDCHTLGKNQPLIDGETGEILERPLFANRYNYKEFFQSDGIENTQPSETIPGQDMSITDMMERYRNGQAIPVSNMEYLENEEPLPVMEDLTDIEEGTKYIKNFNDKLEKAKQKAKEKPEQKEPEKEGEKPPKKVDE